MTMIKRLGNIEISGNDVSEYDNNQKVVIISTDKIDIISIEIGFSEERPVFSMIFGIITITLGFIFGILPIMNIVLTSVNGDPALGAWGIFVFALPLFYIGGWFILKTFRYGYFLKVVTAKRIRKLSFGKSIKKASIQNFVEECNCVFEKKIIINSKWLH